MAALLEAKNIDLRFGGVAALIDLNVDIQEDEILGLIGPNGSGKTTFINVLTKIYSPDKGIITFNGERIEHLPDRVLLYADDGEAAVAAAHARGLEPVQVLVRRSSLEDVFLRLTGRSLIE